MVEIFEADDINPCTDERFVRHDDYEELRDAVVALRRAQRAYLADRGNEELGAAVARAAAYVDGVLRV